jgi:hypothetical protein
LTSTDCNVPPVDSAVTVRFTLFGSQLASGDTMSARKVESMPLPPSCAQTPDSSPHWSIPVDGTLWVASVRLVTCDVALLRRLTVGCS